MAASASFSPDQFALDWLRGIRGNPLQLLRFQMSNRRRFMAEMLGCDPAEYRHYNPVPMSVAMLIAELRLEQSREFFLWSDEASFTVEHEDGSKHTGHVVLLDRGDRVEIDFHPVWDRGWDEHLYVLQATVEVDVDGKLRIPAAPYQIYGLYSPCGQWATLREHHGEVDLVYFNRVDAIREDWSWPDRFIGRLEDLRRDLDAERDGSHCLNDTKLSDLPERTQT